LPDASYKARVLQGKKIWRATTHRDNAQERTAKPSIYQKKHAGWLLKLFKGTLSTGLGFGRER